MSSLNPSIFSAARAVERDVGGGTSPSPRPPSSHTFNINPFARFVSVAHNDLSVSKIVTHSGPDPAFRVPFFNSLYDKIPTSSSHISSAILPTSHSLPRDDLFMPPTHHDISPDHTSHATSSHPALFTNYPPASTASRVIKPRKPRAGCEIDESPLRPHVAATDRLFAWDTPFGIQHRSQLSSIIPEVLVDPVLMSIRGALAPQTKSSYAAGLLRWTQFCDKYSIPEADRMPASYALICAFVAEHKGLQIGGVIKNWLSGIRSWHVINHAPWYGEDDPWVDFARKAANKEGAKHKRPLRAPISIEHLASLRGAISLSDPFHTAVWAVALCTFWGCRRLGETTISVEASFDESYHVLRSSPYVSSSMIAIDYSSLLRVSFRILRDGTYSAHFRIPWTKTTKEEGATVILTGRNDALCPCRALRNHLDINADIPSSAGLFAYHLPSGAHRNMIKHVFINFITSIWQSASLAHVSGHSFRIGGAVELLLAGVPPEVVAATGGWTSLSFLLYWRRMEEILPMSTSKAYKKIHIDELAGIFERFRIEHNIARSLLDSSTDA
jgi:hypothetical protein